MFNTHLIGHIGQDAVARDVAGAKQTAIGFSVAYSERYTDAQGIKHERTTWVECTLWRDKDKLGIVPYLVKGQLVHVEGRVEAASYLHKETGELTQKLRLRVKEVTLLGASNANQQKQAQAQAQAYTPQQHQQPPAGWQQQPQQPQQPAPQYQQQQPVSQYVQPQQPYGAVDQAALQRMHVMNPQPAQPQYAAPSVPGALQDDLPF
jgi:single-strand DNA-binding protein